MSAGEPVLELAIGIVLIILVRWLSRMPRSTWTDWITLRVGQVLFTEVAAAFLIGHGFGEILAPAVGVAGPPGTVRIGFGRPGMLDPGRLPMMLGIVGGAVALLLRIDLADVFLRGSTPSSVSAFIGQECRVITTIPEGGVGLVAVRDGAGRLISASATANANIQSGTIVQITGTKERILVVEAIRAVVGKTSGTRA